MRRRAIPIISAAIKVITYPTPVLKQIGTVRQCNFARLAQIAERLNLAASK